ncbi:MAG TPA: carbohydrate-binding protein, partial [Nitrolancea sp.]|nr:carbohydrate-binding protein [Nitrolancea sp.]
TGGYNLNYVDVNAAVVSPPDPPTGLSATAVSSSEIDLNWTDTATNATAYTVERSLDQTSWAIVTSTLPANATSYNDTALNSSTTYYYEVLATNSGGSSDPSNIAHDQTQAATDTIGLPGRIEAENYRLGGEGVGYHDTTPGNTGNADRHDDVDIQTCTDAATVTGMPCYNVGWIAAGEWLAYDVNVAAAGNYNFTTRVASTTGTSSFHIEVDGTNVTGAISVPNTGGNQTWVSIGTSSIPLTAGAHTLTIVFDTGGYNVDYVDVAPVESTQAVTLPGHIEVENYIAGGEGVGYHDTTPSNLGGAYQNDGVDIQTCADPSTPSGQTCYNVGWTVAGEWLAYNVNFADAGNYTFAIRLSTTNNGEKLHLELDGTDISGSIAVPNTGSWQAWTTVTTGPIALPAGPYTLTIVEDTGGYNLNYVDIAAAP